MRSRGTSDYTTEHKMDFARLEQIRVILCSDNSVFSFGEPRDEEMSWKVWSRWTKQIYHQDMNLPRFLFQECQPSLSESIEYRYNRN